MQVETGGTGIIAAILSYRSIAIIVVIIVIIDGRKTEVTEVLESTGCLLE